MFNIITPNGFRFEAKDECINISLDSNLILSYHPAHGEVVTGVHTPARIVEAREALKYGRDLLESNA